MLVFWRLLTLPGQTCFSRNCKTKTFAECRRRTRRRTRRRDFTLNTTTRSPKLPSKKAKEISTDCQRRWEYEIGKRRGRITFKFYYYYDYDMLSNNLSSSSRRSFCNSCNCSEQGSRTSGNPKIDPRDASLRSPSSANEKGPVS
jgi:hypothetical protein